MQLNKKLIFALVFGRVPLWMEFYAVVSSIKTKTNITLHVSWLRETLNNGLQHILRFTFVVPSDSSYSHHHTTSAHSCRSLFGFLTTDWIGKMSRNAALLATLWFCTSVSTSMSALFRLVGATVYSFSNVAKKEPFVSFFVSFLCLHYVCPMHCSVSCLLHSFE